MVQNNWQRKKKKKIKSALWFRNVAIQLKSKLEYIMVIIVYSVVIHLFI